MLQRAQLLFLMLLALPAAAQQTATGDSKVTDIWLVFKTHFDLGFTDLPENVFQRYRGEMMDGALKIIDDNAKLPPEKRFTWTVPGWPLSEQVLGPLQTPGRKQRIEKAVRDGAIAVHAYPFTTHMSRSIMRTLSAASRFPPKWPVHMACRCPSARN